MPFGSIVSDSTPLIHRYRAGYLCSGCCTPQIPVLRLCSFSELSGAGAETCYPLSPEQHMENAIVFVPNLRSSSQPGRQPGCEERPDRNDKRAQARRFTSTVVGNSLKCGGMLPRNGVRGSLARAPSGWSANWTKVRAGRSRGLSMSCASPMPGCPWALRARCTILELESSNGQRTNRAEEL
jgi:hypothetical protein